MKVPFVDLVAQYNTIKNQIDSEIKNVILESAFIGGEYVRKFESDFSGYLNSNYFIGCANGTDSIEIILQALKIGSGDEVIVPALTWISTAEAVSNVGAKPVFVDINNDDFTISLEGIKGKISTKTKAIIPVHLYGKMAKIEELVELANKKNIYIIEDCAQAHGAQLNGKKAGTFGIAGSYSFYPGKNLGAYGDAGGICTNDELLAKKMRALANHGQPSKHTHLYIGRNSRLDGLQAAILSAKLKYINEWTARRIYIANEYRKQLSNNSKIILPKEDNLGSHVYHLFVIRCKDRNRKMEKLKKEGIEVAIHYPTPLPFVDCYKYLGYKHEDIPIAAKITEEIISLPIYPEMTSDMINYICDCLQN